MNSVQLREAKAKFSELVEAAERGETTIITKYGKPVARIMPLSDKTASSKMKSIVDVLFDIPGPLDIDRDPVPLREIDF